MQDYPPPYSSSSPEQMPYPQSVSNPNWPTQPSTNPSAPPPPPIYGQQPPIYGQQPYFPPPQVPRPRRVVPLWLFIVVLAWALLASVGAIVRGGSSGPSSVTANPTSSTTNNSSSAPTATTAPGITPAATQGTGSSGNSQHYHVGDVVNANNLWQVTVNSVKTSAGKDYNKPDDGKIFFEIDVALKNTSNKEQDLSSLLQFSLSDDTGLKYDESFLTDADNNAPDGKVEAGAPIRGTLTFQVPTDLKSAHLNFEPDPFGEGLVIWDLTVS